MLSRGTFLQSTALYVPNRTHSDGYNPSGYSRIHLRFCGARGKGVVRCKDTPNFIANRIGIFSVLHTIHLMLEEGYTIDEVDAITGPPMGRPRSATFRLGDIIGLDVLVDVANNVYENARNDEQREIFRVPDFILQMVEKGWLGEKTGGGFYQRRRGENGSEIWTLDYNTLEYVPRSTALSPPLAGG